MYVKKLVILFTAIVLFISFSGCEREEVVTTIETGSISGLVQDTNGNPLSGVKVIFMDKETTTNEGGIYYFENIPSISIGTNQSLTIIAPQGYLGATVTIVEPTYGENDEIFANVGSAVLPELNSTVTGVVRDLDTGSAVVGAEVNLDMLKGGSNTPTSQEQVQNKVTTTYAVTTYKTITDINGNYTLSNIPSDSMFAVYIPGYEIDDNTTSLKTDNEGYQVVKRINVTKIDFKDKTSPYVKSVEYIVDNNVSCGLLDSSTNNNITINFSEVIDFILEDTSVLIYTGKDDNVTKITTDNISLTGNSNRLTISIDQTLVAGDSLDVHLLKHNFVDANKNTLTINDSVGYDSNQGNYITLKLKIFEELNLNAESVSDIKQLAEHISDEENDDLLVQAKSDTFKDILDGTEKFQQLNSSEAQDRLEELIIKLGGKGIEVDKARISFTPKNAAKYLITVEDETKNSIPQSDVANSLKISSNVEVLADFNNTNKLEIKLYDLNTVELYLENVKPNDIVTVTPVDELGYKGTQTVIKLVDNVAPTTVLQTSYYDNASAGDNGVVETTYGNGGELSNKDGSITIGTPYLAITNSLLDNLKSDGSPANGTAGNTPDRSLYAELYKWSTNPSSRVYDAKGFAAFNTDSNLTRIVGVSFSENIVLNNANTPSFDGTSGMLSDFKVNNDVERFIDGNTVLNVDLVNMKVKNIIKLANNEHLKTINYSGIEDEAGNKATDATNAKVIIKDELSPLVKSAKFDKEGKIVIQFNEAIILDNTTEIKISGDGSSTAFYHEDKWVLNADKTELTIDFSEFDSNPINKKSFWNRDVYASDKYSNDLTERNHAYLEFNTIKDSQGNSWDSYMQKTRVESRVTAPQFALPFMIDPLKVKEVLFETKASDTNKTNSVIQYTFNHPIQDGSYPIDDLNEIKKHFSIKTADGTDGTILNNDSTKITLSADRKTMTFSFTAVDENGKKLQEGAKIIVKKAGVQYINAYDTDNKELKNDVSITY